MDQLELPADLPIDPTLALRLAGSLAFHPFEYAKVLIQLGHEPVAPRQTRTLLGRPALAYPSVFQYCAHIRRRDGWLGLWRGASPRLLSQLAHHAAEVKFNKLFPAEEAVTGEEDDEGEDADAAARKRFLRSLLRDLACRVSCVVATQPLQVLATRAMAEFIGREEKYSGHLLGGLYSGAVDVIRENGLLGFWSGLVPRLAGELGVLGLTASITFLVNTYVLEDKEVAQYTKHAAGFLAGSLCYPFTVSSTCMAVRGSGLAAGFPPAMPLYTGWLDCLADLRSKGQLKRGSAMLFRYYTGPQQIVGDRVISLNSSMFAQPKSA